MSAAIACPGKPPSARRRREIFHDNTKAWSGDHCVDPSVVPGVLFCNRPIETNNPRLLDIGPTVLDMFGVPMPDYMDGKALAVGDDAKPASRTLRPQLQRRRHDGRAHRQNENRTAARS